MALSKSERAGDDTYGKLVDALPKFSSSSSDIWIFGPSSRVWRATVFFSGYEATPELIKGWLSIPVLYRLLFSALKISWIPDGRGRKYRTIHHKQVQCFHI